MRFEINVLKKLPLALSLVWSVSAAVGVAAAEAQDPVVLVLDQTAIVYGDGHPIAAEAANAGIANVGLRDTLPFFAARVGETMSLPGGVPGNDGWFAIRTIPASWASEPGANDELENFLLAGPGLGSPDDDGNRTSLLASVADVVPLRLTGLTMLMGRRVCAVVYDGDVTVAAGDVSTANMSGNTLGVIAFQIAGVEASDSDWPGLSVQVLDVSETCRGALAAFSEAPQP